jgi:chaperonin cofactor prefoldin
MTFIQENLQILATLGSALSVYIFMRLGARKDIKEVEKRLDIIEVRLEKVEIKIDSMNTRLTRLEGRFEERGYWESREPRRNGTDE